MKLNPLPFLFILGLLVYAAPVQAQHHQTIDDPHPVPAPVHQANHPSGFRLGGVVGYVILPTATAHGRESLILPSLGFDLEYWFSPKWGLGLHNDVELMVFEVETEEDLFIEREFPVLITLDALWKPWKGLVLFGGPGVELEPTEHYWVGRVGVEYEIPIGPSWDIFPMFFHDFRKGAYDTYSFGLGVGKRF